MLLGFAFPLWAERVDSWKNVQNLNPVRVRVVGWQFGWTYHYAGADGKFGRVDPHLISGSNDLGIDYTDPNALDDFTSPILKLPVNQPAVLNIGTKDVIHNYSIVPMRIQQDAIPGREIPMWFTPIKTSGNLRRLRPALWRRPWQHGRHHGSDRPRTIRFLVQGPDRGRAQGKQPEAGGPGDRAELADPRG